MKPSQALRNNWASSRMTSPTLMLCTLAFAIMMGAKPIGRLIAAGYGMTLLYILIGMVALSALVLVLVARAQKRAGRTRDARRHVDNWRRNRHLWPTYEDYLAHMEKLDTEFRREYPSSENEDALATARWGILVLKQEERDQRTAQKIVSGSDRMVTILQCVHVLFVIGLLAVAYYVFAVTHGWWPCQS